MSIQRRVRQKSSFSRFPNETNWWAYDPREYGDTISESCVDEDSTPWARIAREELNSETKGSMSISATNIIKFRCPAAWRIQLRAHACNGFFPTEQMASIESAMKYLTTSAPQNPALAVVLDASGLIQLGQVDCNTRLLEAGSRLYCQALGLLQKEISSLSASSDGSILAAIHVMQVCDIYTGMPYGDVSWRQHAQGISTMLSARKTKLRSEEFKALLSRNFRMFGFWNGVLSRKGINHVLPEQVNPLESAAVRVPGALEDFDNLAFELPDKRTQRCLSLLECLTEIEKDLKQWSLVWYRNMRKPPFALVDAGTLPFLQSRSGVFAQILQFVSLSNATDHILCTTSLLLIRQIILQINLMLHPSIKTSAYVRSITDCADSLCMSIPYLCMPQHRIFGGHSALGPLTVAWAWYSSQPRSHKIEERLLWCEETAQYFQQQRGFHMMSTEHDRNMLLITSTLR